jgi:precorrin-6B methylase 2
MSTELSPQRIFSIAFAYAPTLVLDAALDLQLFNHLAGGPQTLANLVAETCASERGLRAILNALVGYELLQKTPAGEYALTPESEAFLVQGKPSYFGGLIRHGAQQILPKWQQMRQVVRTGKPDFQVNQQQEGAEFFEQFVEDIFPMSYPAAQALAAAWNVSGVTQDSKVLDIAAGSGVWGVALAQASSHISVTAVDWPNVLKVTRRVAERFGFGDRLNTIEGDILKVDFGTGYQFATLGHILHSEGEARGRELLKKVYDALAPGGRIAIAEFVTNADRTGPAPALTFAVNMLVCTEEGNTFSFEEMTAWLEDLGFHDIQQVPVPGPSPLLVATK